MNNTNDIVERLRKYYADKYIGELTDKAADLIEQQKTKINKLDKECGHWMEMDRKNQQRIAELEAALKEFESLKDRFDNGIKYDEELNVYTVRWTERELENARKAAAEIYEKIHWEPALEDKE